MHLSRLAVTDFRSWPAAELALGPGVSVLVGPNGAGKTNLVEAVGYLATFSSHRVATDAPLIRRGARRAVVRGLAVRAGRELSVEVEITSGQGNRARVNRSVLPRAREALGVVRSVLFAPEDLALVRGDPGERRRLLDELLVSRSPRFAGIRADYDRVVRQRTALLKTGRGGRSGGADARAADSPDSGGAHRAGELSTLDVWDGHLARHGAALLAGRLRLAEELTAPVREAYAEVAGPSSAAVPAALRYRPSVPGASAAMSAQELEAGLLAELVRVRGQELERGVCLVGPHRDELELLLGDVPAKGHASHGEAWSLALALRLGSFELLRSEIGGTGDSTDPILVLDDVFAELDVWRRRALAELAVRAEQVLVTAAVPDDVPEKLHGARFTVGQGEVRGPG